MVTEKLLSDEGYLLPVQLPDGRWIALRRMTYTIGLFVGLDEVGYSSRYCYPLEHEGDAVVDVLSWDGTGHPPGRWIKHKGHCVDELNPRWLDEAKAEMAAPAETLR